MDRLNATSYLSPEFHQLAKQICSSEQHQTVSDLAQLTLGSAQPDQNTPMTKRISHLLKELGTPSQSIEELRARTLGHELACLQALEELARADAKDPQLPQTLHQLQDKSLILLKEGWSTWRNQAIYDLDDFMDAYGLKSIQARCAFIGAVLGADQVKEVLQDLRGGGLHKTGPVAVRAYLLLAADFGLLEEARTWIGAQIAEEAALSADNWSDLLELGFDTKNPQQAEQLLNLVRKRIKARPQTWIPRLAELELSKPQLRALFEYVYRNRSESLALVHAEQFGLERSYIEDLVRSKLPKQPARRDWFTEDVVSWSPLLSVQALVDDSKLLRWKHDPRLQFLTLATPPVGELEGAQLRLQLAMRLGSRFFDHLSVFQLDRWPESAKIKLVEHIASNHRSHIAAVLAKLGLRQASAEFKIALLDLAPEQVSASHMDLDISHPKELAALRRLVAWKSQAGWPGSAMDVLFQLKVSGGEDILLQLLHPLDGSGSFIDRTELLEPELLLHFCVRGIVGGIQDQRKVAINMLSSLPKTAPQAEPWMRLLQGLEICEDRELVDFYTSKLLPELKPFPKLDQRMRAKIDMALPYLDKFPGGVAKNMMRHELAACALLAIYELAKSPESLQDAVVDSALSKSLIPLASDPKRRQQLEQSFEQLREELPGDQSFDLVCALPLELSELRALGEHLAGLEFEAAPEQELFDLLKALLANKSLDTEQLRQRTLLLLDVQNPHQLRRLAEISPQLPIELQRACLLASDAELGHRRPESLSEDYEWDLRLCEYTHAMGIESEPNPHILKLKLAQWSWLSYLEARGLEMAGLSETITQVAEELVPLLKGEAAKHIQMARTHSARRDVDLLIASGNREAAREFLEALHFYGDAPCGPDEVGHYMRLVTFLGAGERSAELKFIGQLGQKICTQQREGAVLAALGLDPNLDAERELLVDLIQSYISFDPLNFPSWEELGVTTGESIQSSIYSYIQERHPEEVDTFAHRFGQAGKESLTRSSLRELLNKDPALAIRRFPALQLSNKAPEDRQFRLEFALAAAKIAPEICATHISRFGWDLQTPEGRRDVFSVAELLLPAESRLAIPKPSETWTSFCKEYLLYLADVGRQLDYLVDHRTDVVLSQDERAELFRRSLRGPDGVRLAYKLPQFKLDLTDGVQRKLGLEALMLVQETDSHVLDAIIRHVNPSRGEWRQSIFRNAPQILKECSGRWREVSSDLGVATVCLSESDPAAVAQWLEYNTVSQELKTAYEALPESDQLAQVQKVKTALLSRYPELDDLVAKVSKLRAGSDQATAILQIAKLRWLAAAALGAKAFSLDLNDTAVHNALGELFELRDNALRGRVTIVLLQGMRTPMSRRKYEKRMSAAKPDAATELARMATCASRLDPEAVDALFKAYFSSKSMRKDPANMRTFLRFILELDATSVLDDAEKVNLLKILSTPTNKGYRHLRRGVLIAQDMLQLRQRAALLEVKTRDQLIASLEETLKQQLPIDPGPDFAANYEKTLGNFEKKGQLLTYCGRLRTLSGEAGREALQALGLWINLVLKGESQQWRNQLENAPTLRVLSSEQREKWTAGDRVAVSELQAIEAAENQAFSFVEECRTKLEVDKHLGPTWKEDYPYVAKFLGETSLGVDLTEQISALLEKESKNRSLKLQLFLIRFLIGPETFPRSDLRRLQNFASGTELGSDIAGWAERLTNKARAEQLWVADTDDPELLFRSGSDVRGSCQRVDGNPELNQGLLGTLLDGHVRMICALDAGGGIRARRLLRLMTLNDKPALYLERLYESGNDEAARKATIQMAKRRAKELGVPLYTDGRQRTDLRAVLGENVPVIYVDGAGGLCRGEYGVSYASLLYNPED